jgi:hypothetical protein
VNPGITRKSVRIATVLAGATACAAFVPAANAQAAKPVSGSAQKTPVSKSVRYNTLGGRGPGTIVCSRTPTWFHTYQLVSSYCTAGPGTFLVPDLAHTGDWGFCGGNNKGYFSGSTLSGVHQKHTFGHGTNIYVFQKPKFPYNIFYISKVHISSWSGNDTCPSTNPTG